MAQGVKSTGDGRDRVLAAAAKVMSERGYSGTRLADVAAEARLQAPALYHYFSSRAELLAEVVYEGQRRLYEGVSEVLDRLPADTPPDERLDTIVRAHLEVALRESDFAKAVSRNATHMPPDVQKRLRELGRGYLQLWERELSAVQDAGMIDAGVDVGTARMLVIGSLNGSSEWYRQGRGALEQIVVTAQRMTRGALGLAVRVPAGA